MLLNATILLTLKWIHGLALHTFCHERRAPSTEVSLEWKPQSNPLVDSAQLPTDAGTTSTDSSKGWFYPSRMVWQRFKGSGTWPCTQPALQLHCCRIWSGPMGGMCRRCLANGWARRKRSYHFVTPIRFLLSWLNRSECDQGTCQRTSEQEEAKAEKKPPLAKMRKKKVKSSLSWMPKENK